MIDLYPPTTPTPSATQATLAACRTVTTKDRRFRIRFPLPPASTKRVLPSGTHAHVILRSINAILNRGQVAIDPLTGGLIAIYRRTMRQKQVSLLKKLRTRQRELDADWLHLSHFTGYSDGDLAKLVLWGLVESRPQADCPSDKPRGWWRATGLAFAWLTGRERLPRQVAVLLGERLGFVDDSDLIGPEDVDERFDRDALHAPAVPAAS